jgi:hypothetical protein
MGVAAARIGTGVGFFIAGAVFFGLAAFGALASQAAFAGMCAVLGGSLIAIGFWVRLFGMVERRLMDIERRLAGVSEPPSEPKNPEAAATDADVYYG